MTKRTSLIGDIMKLLSIQSVTHNEKGIKECQNVVVQIADDMGFKSSFHGNNKVLIIEPQEQCEEVPALGIVVHIDTVPFDEKSWSYNPLGEIVNDRIYGRGIVDDKGPIAIALHVLNDLKGRIKPSWQIIIGSSEEDEWVDMQEFLAEKPVLPKFLVTVDGDGVQNGCRGYADVLLKFSKEKHTNHITEFYVPNGMNNTVPARAVAVIDGNNVTGVGKEVHSSISNKGHSAITDLAKKIKSSYSDAYLEFKNMFDLLCELDASSDGEIIGLINNNECEVESNVSATLAHIDEDEAIVNLNIRIGLGVTKEEVIIALENLCRKYKCGLDITKLIMPSYITSDSKEIEAMCDAYQEVIGRRPDVSIARGLGYNAALPSCAIFGPMFDVKDEDEEDTCHQADETRSIKNIFTFYDVLKAFLIKTL